MAFSIWLASIFSSDTGGGNRDSGGRRDGSSSRPSPASDPLTDSGFANRLRDGEPGAFDTLFTATYAGLVRFGTRLVGSQESAEDLVMEVFRRVWERRTEWTPKDVRVYLYGAVRNAAATARRDQKTREHLLERPEEAVMRGAMAMDDIHQHLLDEERLELLRRAVDTLPERQRFAFTLRREQGLTNAQVAEILGIAVKTVEKELTAALKTLRIALAGYRDV